MVDQREGNPVPRSEWAFTGRAPIALTELMAGNVPKRSNVTEGLGIYANLAQVPLTILSATKQGSNDKEFIMVGPSLTAEQVNGLLYFAAPWKAFKFDTQDIINDWTNLYRDPIHAKLKDAHVSMTGWTQFEQSRERILGVLQRNYLSRQFRQQDSDDVIVPVLRWTIDREGNRRIVLEPMDDGLRDALGEAMPDIKDTQRFDSGMGTIFIAAYSPDQTQWPSRDGFRHSNSQRQQVIGPTQVLAYAYREIAKQQADPSSVSPDKNVQTSPLLKALETYSETGVVPTPTVKDTGSPNTDDDEIKIPPILTPLEEKKEKKEKKNGGNQLNQAAIIAHGILLDMLEDQNPPASTGGNLEGFTYKEIAEEETPSDLSVTIFEQLKKLGISDQIKSLKEVIVFLANTGTLEEKIEPKKNP